MQWNGVCENIPLYLQYSSNLFVFNIAALDVTRIKKVRQIVEAPFSHNSEEDNWLHKFYQHQWLRIVNRLYLFKSWFGAVRWLMDCIGWDCWTKGCQQPRIEGNGEVGREDATFNKTGASTFGASNSARLQPSIDDRLFRLLRTSHKL